MVEAVWSESPRPSFSEGTDGSLAQQQTQSPSQQSSSQQSQSGGSQSQQLQVSYGNLLGPNRRESVQSPSASRRAKQHRGMNGK